MKIRTRHRAIAAGANVPVALLFLLAFSLCCERVDDPEPPSGQTRTDGERMGALIVYMDPGIAPRRADSVFAAARALGIQWVRIGFIWAVINPEKDRYEWGEIDRIIDSACRYGLSVLPMFTWTPQWAASVPQSTLYMFHAPSAGKIGDYDAGLGSVGTGYDYLAQCAETVSRRYKDKISHWELWNEPDMYGFYRSSAGEYGKMLHYFNHAIKKGNPDAKVVLGGLAQGEPAWGCDTAFFAKTLRDEAYPVHHNFDVYNFHVNFKTAADINRQIAETEQMLSAHKLQKTYWITEASYTSDRRHQSLPGYKSGEESLGAYISGIYREALLRSEAEVVFWAALHDYLPSTAESDPYKYSGLYTFDLKLKPAGDTLRRMANTPEEESK
ncbi:MAG: beta-galactosidase [Tannerellaceae bacterium]|jgi:hypothetical protein|nr:beta-galactosidase [Tannerellaceae bacterium]